jgi:hypothetical protein
MMRNLVLYCIFIRLISGLQHANVSICVGRNATSEFVINFCNDQNGTFKHRCCRSNDGTSFIAIDLMQSNFTTIPDFAQDENLILSVIDLRSNPQIIPSPDSDFLAMTYLNDLILPDQMTCPGGLRVWEIINRTTDPSGTRCLNQKDICANATDVCDEKNSLCNSNGPNHFSCLCKDNYHGYKCLRYGIFPTAIFFGSAAGVTIVTSIFLYWTQRRHVVKK